MEVSSNCSLQPGLNMQNSKNSMAKLWHDLIIPWKTVLSHIVWATCNSVWRTEANLPEINYQCKPTSALILICLLTLHTNDCTQRLQMQPSQEKSQTVDIKTPSRNNICGRSAKGQCGLREAQIIQWASALKLLTWRLCVSSVLWSCVSTR